MRLDFVLTLPQDCFDPGAKSWNLLLRLGFPISKMAEPPLQGCGDPGFLLLEAAPQGLQNARPQMGAQVPPYGVGPVWWLILCQPGWAMVPRYLVKY